MTLNDVMAVILHYFTKFGKQTKVHERYRQTTDRRQTDRRQTDGRRHIANINMSSRSLKTNTDPVFSHGPQTYTLLLVFVLKIDDVVLASVVRYPRYFDTYRRYLCDDTSIANVTIYRGIS